MQILFPQPPSQEYLVRLIRAQYELWREEQEAKAPQWKPENIRFEHDPHWRERFWSIDGIGKNPNLFWRGVRVAHFAAAAAPYLIRIISG